MSVQQHAKDIKKIGEDAHKPPCLNRHISAFEDGDTCSHRWQAYEKAKGDSKVYNWRKYAELLNKKVKTSAILFPNGKLWPPWYRQTLNLKEEKAWDIDDGPNKSKNFREKCNVPYWHNAHHLVPNAELKGAIATAGSGMKDRGKTTWAIRAGLLEASYNLNDKKNMFLLPMDRKVGGALGLPVHLQTAVARSHGRYSTNVKIELDKLFASLKSQLKKHKKADPADYASLKSQIEDLSEHLYSMVKASGAPHLDAIPKSAFTPPEPS